MNFFQDVKPFNIIILIDKTDKLAECGSIVDLLLGGCEDLVIERRGMK